MHDENHLYGLVFIKLKNKETLIGSWILPELEFWSVSLPAYLTTVTRLELFEPFDRLMYPW